MIYYILYYIYQQKKRPDIIFTVNQAVRFSENLTKASLFECRYSNIKIF